MRTLRRIALDLVVFVAIIGSIFYLYQTYGKETAIYLFGESKNTIFVDDLSVIVTIADTTEERRVGLSRVSSLPDREGKLFIFDEEEDYGFWMKDMLIPIDIFWVNNNMEIVQIEKNVKPESYPATYHSPQPARFVLEFNAFFADTFKIEVGDRVTIPANDLPKDLVENLKR